MKFVLVDGSSYLFRAFHALPPLTTATGLSTGAVFGVINMLRRLLKEEAPTHIAVVFDSKGKNFRHEMYPGYKGNRPEMPEELAEQIKPLHRLIEAMGLPLVCVPGVEADDVIGTLAHIATEQGIDTLISTSDKDMAQLVTEHVELVNTMTQTRMDRKGVKEKFGVYPEQIIDYLALVGDTSDNVPGVPKVGPKTAAKWLNEYQTLDRLVSNADTVKGKVGENLRDNLEQLALSKKLVTIKTDVELEMMPKDLEPGLADNNSLRELFKTLEFKTWLQMLDKPTTEAASPAPSKSSTETTVVLDEATLKAWVEKCEKAGQFAVDTETDGLNYMQANLVGISLAVSQEEHAYIPVGHQYEGAPKQLDLTLVISALNPLLESPKIIKIGHHIKFDAHILKRHGAALAGPLEDTMLLSYVLNATLIRHDMDSVSKEYLGHSPVPYEQIAGKGAKQKTLDQVEIETVAEYAGEDAWVTYALYEKIKPQLTADLLSVYESIEQPLIPVLTDMEHMGVLIDTKKLLAQSEHLAERCQALELQAHDVVGEVFNLGSPKQLQAILYEKMGLPVVQKTPKGQPSTSEPVLAELAADYELAQIILDYRSLSKLKSTYTDKLPELVDVDTKRVHTSYHQAIVATGRLSSSDPNLQNIPVRTAEGRQIREAFIAEKGFSIVAADYSQIELRIMAHLSGDERLIEAFSKGEDIHQFTASEIFAEPLEAVTSDQRRSAKAINFGLIYGMSAFGLAKQIGVDRSTAQEYMNHYFERYPAVKDYMEKTREEAAKSGYVETLFGRRLYLRDINSRNMNLRRAAERAAINAPMQGTAADLIKKAMITLWAKTHNNQAECRLIMQVHDELIFEIKDNQVQKWQSIIETEMAKADDGKLSVPLEVSIGQGHHWEAAH